MAKIKYIEHNGKEHEIDVANGFSVMEGAVQKDIPGIDADCGGGMACATCHVYVKEEWFNKLPQKEEGEEDMLDMAFEPKKNSRLSCQLIVSNQLEGAVVASAPPLEILNRAIMTALRAKQLIAVLFPERMNTDSIDSKSRRLDDQRPSQW